MAAVRHRVRLAIGVAGEVLDQLPDFLGRLAPDAAPGRAAQEALLQRRDPLGRALLRDRLPQRVAVLEREPGDHRRHFEDVLLEEHHAVGVAEDFFQARIEIRRRLFAQAAADEALLHPAAGRAGPDERKRVDHVEPALGADHLQEAAHAGRLDLEAADRPPRAQQRGGLAVAVGDLRQERPRSPRLRCDGDDRVGDERERAMAEQVNLHQPDRLDGVHLELRDDDPLRRALERQVIGQRAVADDDAADVDAQVARESVQRLGARDDGAVRLAVEREIARLGEEFLRVADALGRVMRQHRGEAVDLLDRQPEDARHVAERRPRLVRIVVADHRHAVGAVALVDVIDHFVAPPPAEVEVNVRAIGAASG